MTPPIPSEILRETVRLALAEDVGAGDLTAAALIPADLEARAVFIAEAGGVIAGLPLAAEVFRQLGAEAWQVMVAEGEEAAPGTELAIVEGPARAILTGERAALNFLQHLSGVATATHDCVRRVSGTRCRIVDTRKTTPGLRWLEKYAVRCGGGTNHRMGLFDEVLIKENHISLAGGIAAALERARAGTPAGTQIQVEVRGEEELRQALEAGATAILLDNFDLPALAGAVALVAGRAELEASGGIRPETVAAVAGTGVDRVSLGWITHSAPALDISLDVTLAG